MASSADRALPTPARRPLGLGAGALTGLVVGFAVGLARPRPRGSIATTGTTGSRTHDARR